MLVAVDSRLRNINVHKILALEQKLGASRFG
jgi:hypothetical protein